MRFAWMPEGRKDHPPSLGGCATFGAVSLAAVLVLLGAFWYEVGEAAVITSDTIPERPLPSSSASLASGPVPEGHFHSDAGRRWIAVAETVSDGAHRVRIHNVSGAEVAGRLTMSEVIGLWKSDPAFASFYAQLLQKSPHKSFFWECPYTSKARMAEGQLFEHVTVGNPYGFAPADSSDFSEYLSRCSAGTGAVAFQNLGGDASLVAPCDAGPSGAYGHLAAFSRQAAEEQQRRFWAVVGTTLEDVVASRGGRGKTWPSTEGSGVPWLHVRMDSWPKYYHHLEYRSEE